jgi:pimeloyl-ACP methyl ester carboxylesterase
MTRTHPATTSTEESAARSGFLPVPDGELFYELQGQGRAVMLLHAGLMTRHQWDAQWPLLVSEHRVLRYDARGHGQSSAPAGDYAHYEDLRYVMEGLGVERAVLVGLSLGARTAIDFALAYPEMVEGLVLASPGVSGWEFRDPFVVARQREMLEAAAARDAGALVELALRTWVDGPHRAPEQVDAAVREHARAMIWASLPKQAAAQGELLEIGAADRTAELRAPIVAIYGGADASDMREIVDLLGHTLPSAKTAVLAGAGHMLNLEQPEEFNRLLLDFLRSAG